MDIKEFKNIEKKVKKPEFSRDFKSLNGILKSLSILGNISSVFLASIFISQLFKVAIDNPIIYWGISIIALTGLELTKREVFFRFSRDFIRIKKIFTKNVLPMLFFTMVLISMSFYSSLSGAQKFGSKKEEIKTNTEKNITSFKDSINNQYKVRISKLEERNEILFKQNNKLDKEARELKSTWVTSKLRIRKQIEKNNNRIDKNDQQIRELKEEKNGKISDYKKKINKKSQQNINKNDKNIFIFISISTIIEFLILFGIYFNNLYNFKSYKDIKNKLMNDKNFRTYYEYTEVMNSIFLNKKEKDLIPSLKMIKKLLEMNKMYLTEEQITSSLDLFEALNIIEKNDGKTYLIKDFEEAESELKIHFNV